MSVDRNKPACIDPAIGAQLVSYALGTLNDSESEAFELHVLHCEACQQELELATPALDTLKSAREQFVERAQLEDETFSAQYDRLKQYTLQPVPARSTGNRRAWLEVMWTAIWGRRWMVGMAGVTAIALMFYLRSGSNLNSPPVASQETRIVDMSQVTKLKAVPSDTADRSASSKPVPVPDEEALLSQAEISLPSTVGGEGLNAIVSNEESVAEPKSSKSSDHHASVPSASQSDHLLSAQGIEKHAEVSAKGVQGVVPLAETVKMDVSAQRPVDYAQFADQALGKFNPQVYHQPEQPEGHSRGGRANREQELPVADKMYSMEKRASSFDEMAIADSMFVHGRFSEARNLYERKWGSDSTELRYPLMAGLSAYQQQDYQHAKVAFEAADRLLAQGAQKENVALLLARVNLLSGHLLEARTCLQGIINRNESPEFVRRAQTAIARIDSIANTSAPK